MKTHLKVSIVIPVYNGGNYLETAIKSALAQTYPNIEVVVVNDGSRDGGHTEAVAQRYAGRIKYIAQPNMGVAAALNAGLAHMTGDIFAWLSHDDVHLPHKTARQIHFFEKLGRDDAMLFSDYYLIDEAGKHITEVKLDHERYVRAPMFPLFNGCINGCTLFIPAHIMRKYGPFDSGLRFSQDYDLWNKMLRDLDFFHQPETLIEYRMHPEQDTQKQKSNAALECDGLWKRMLDDRTEIERVHMFGSTSKFFSSLADFLDKTPYNGAARYAHERAKRVIDDCLVSVIIPFFNEVDKATDAARSVLNQTHRKIELILVDDGSTEDIRPIEELVRLDRRARLFRQSNAGPGAARNEGLAKASGDYIAFLDADDLYAPHKIRTQLEAMEENGYLVSHTSYLIWFPERYADAICLNLGETSGMLFPEIIASCPLSATTIMIHRAVVAAGFQYLTDIRFGEDVFTYVWLAHRYPVLGIAEPLSIVEWSATSAAINVDKGVSALTFLVDAFKRDRVYSRYEDQIGRLQKALDRLIGLKNDNRKIARNGGSGPVLDEELIKALFAGQTRVSNRWSDTVRRQFSRDKLRGGADTRDNLAWDSDHQTPPAIDDLVGDIRYSLAQDETMADWWDRAHARNHKVWLTGSTANEVWPLLEIEKHIVPGATVLNIGVGLGHCTRALVSAGCVTHAMDISSIALDRVKDVATPWLAGTPLPADAFDLAISNLVAQHMVNADLEAQIAQVILCLKRHGLFAMQFAIPYGVALREDADSPMSARGGSCQRLPETVKAMAERHGGIVLRDWTCAAFPDHKAAWQVIHIGRA